MSTAWIGRIGHPLGDLIGSARLADALTVAGIATAAGAVFIRRLIGSPGLFAILVVIVLIMVASFVLRRHELEFHGLLPLSLLAFLAWAIFSIFWSQYPLQTLEGLIYLAPYTLMAVYIGLTRDTIQIIRSTGDVLRVVLGLSLALEVFAGVILNAPITLLGIDGLRTGIGPITGIEGTRNLLGLVATVAAVSFVIEWRTQSVTRATSLVSVLLAAAAILLTRSPVTYLVALVVIIAFLVMFAVRRVKPERRAAWQVVVLIGAIVVLGVVWIFRGPLVAAINAGGDLDFRLDIWQQIVPLRDVYGLQGWGWIGRWNRTLFPFSNITTAANRPALSASNAYLDVWFQLGFVGLLLFIGAAGFAFVRSWLLAGQRRSIVYAWFAGVIIALLFTSLAESSILIEFGWLLFVICSVKASQELSWRRALKRSPGDESLEAPPQSG